MSFDLFTDDKAESIFGSMGASIEWLGSVDKIVVDTVDKLRAMVTDLLSARWIAFDVETTGLNIIDDRLVALQFCGRPGRAYFIPIAMMGMQNLSIAEVVVTCGPLWTRGFLAHNASFDWEIMSRYVDFAIEADTLLEAKCLPDLWDTYEHGWGLKSLGEGLLQKGTLEFKALFPKGTKKDSMRFDIVPEPLAVPYACQDVVLTWELHAKFITEMNLDPQGVIYELEHRIIKPISRMELLGVGLDVGMVTRAREEAKLLIAQDLAEIEVYSERPINLNAPAEMAWLLYEKCGLHPTKFTKVGNKPSTDAKVLESLKGKHPVVDIILRYRGLSKLEQAFLGTLPSMVASDGCIHTSYSQWGAITGRASSRNPNLQQIPKERGKSADEFRKAIRSSFTPPAGYTGFLDIDYQAMEYRLFASLSQDPTLLQAFANGIDVHVQTAATLLGLSLEEATLKHNRAKGKTMNFATLYGQGPKAMAEALGCSVQEATRLQAQYWVKMPGVTAFVESVKENARRTGYSSTYFGRQRHLKYINDPKQWSREADERYAVNSTVQGLGADLVKMAIARADKALREFKSRLVLNVHDQLVVAHHPDDNLDHMAEALRESMEIEIPGWVPLLTDPGYGPNWSDIDEYTYPSRRADGTGAPAGLAAVAGADPHVQPLAVDGVAPGVGAVGVPLVAPDAQDVARGGDDPVVYGTDREDLASAVPDSSDGVPVDSAVAEVPPASGADGLVREFSDHLTLSFAADAPKEQVQMIRTLLQVRPGSVPVRLDVAGVVRPTPFTVSVTTNLLQELKRLGVPFTLGAETRRVFSRTLALT